MISASLQGATAPVDTQGWSLADLERFVAAVHLWAALATAGGMATLLLLAHAGRVVLNEAKRGWERAVLLGVPALLAIGLFASDEGSSFVGRVPLVQAGLLRFDIANVTRPFNALAGAAVAAIFSASGAILVGMRRAESPTPAVIAAERLRRLVLIGAITTVLGVLTIGALHRLPGAAVTGALEKPAERHSVLKHARTLLKLPLKEGQKPETHPGLPVVQRWIREATGLDDTAALSLANQIRESAAANPEFQSWFLASRDEVRRAERAKALDGLATSVASWWGLVFTTALVLVYAIGASQFFSAGGLSGAESLALSTQTAGQSSLKWDVVLRVLTALAPLLAAGFAEAINKVVELLQPAA